MKKGHSWKYLVIGLLASVAIFHLVVIYIVIGKNYQLERPDYYEKGLTHQETLDKLAAGKAFSWKVMGTPDQITVQLADTDGQTITQLQNVTIHLIRPNDAGQDQRLKLTGDGNGSFLVRPAKILAKGQWKVLVEAQYQGQPIAYQDRIHI